MTKQKTPTQLKEEIELFCWNSRRWINFMINIPETCPHQDRGIAGKNCNLEDCDYCREEKVSNYYKNKMKLLKEL